MTIDPRIAFWFGVWTSVLLLVASGTVNLTGALPDLWVPVITKWCAILGAINSTILTAASGYSSNKSGPMVSIPALTVVKILLIAFLPLAVVVALVATAPSAEAAQLKPLAVTGDLKKDLNTDGQNLGLVPPSLQVTPTGNVAKDLQAIWEKIITASTTDLTYASKLAASANTPASAVRKQCWDAIVTINNQASGLNLKNADGTPLAKPDPHAFTDVETLAEVVDNLSPSGPLFTACAGAAQLAKTNVLTFVNAVVTGAAGIAAMPIIPGL